MLYLLYCHVALMDEVSRRFSDLSGWFLDVVASAYLQQVHVALIAVVNCLYDHEYA
jgi:hypothetical protein